MNSSFSYCKQFGYDSFLIIALSLLFMPLCAQNTQSVYLSGHGTDDAILWDFCCTDGNNSGKWTQIPVPSNWEFHGFGQFTYGHDKERINESGLYRRTFAVSSDWKKKKVNIVFEGSMTDTEVKVNGRVAGPMHQGAFYCFRYDISKLLNYGKENLLEVTVHKSSSNATVEAAERRADFWVFGGIFRPVWLEALPIEHIERLAIDARSNGKLAMDVYLGKKVSGGQLVAQVKTLDGQPLGGKMIQNIGNEMSLRLSAEYISPALWSSEFPNRYIIEVSLLKDGVVRHLVSEKFGFRTAELRPGDGFYVNDVKVKFKGVNRHTHWPTLGRASNYNISLNDALLIKEMNMNAVRMSHYPPDRHFLDVCDSLGLYVIDELTAWQYPPYETVVGREKVKELITRDVNHPCVVMWANGNEGGFNFDLLPEYARYDIQKRQVIHPWLEEKNVNTAHYISYGAGTGFFFEGDKVFFPTEFLHGLYDGGHGAGLDDYWNLMLKSPLSAGGFLWDFIDQGVVRNDKGGMMDTDGDHGADGIVGPYREKEGSFYAIKEVWSPIYLEGTRFLPVSFDGKIKVENRYHFTNLKECTFSAEWIRFDYPTRKHVSITTEVKVPDVAPGLSGILEVKMPSSFTEYDALAVKALDPFGREIYTWTRSISSASQFSHHLVNTEGAVRPTAQDGTGNICYASGNTQIQLDTVAGRIDRIEVNGRILPLKNGPRFTVGQMELYAMKVLDESKGFAAEFFFRPKGGKKDSRNMIKIRLLPSEWISVEYSFNVGGSYSQIGVTFDFPEEGVESVKWLGDGPYRVWKNRMQGVTLGVWEKAYNNTVTGESWNFPEFKGYYSRLYAADLKLKDGVFKIVTASDNLFLHLFTPESPIGRNNDNTLGVFPDGDISILNAISPVGTKFKKAEELGPQSQKNRFSSSSHASALTGKFYLKFEPTTDEGK